jgi:hypothetical protein
MLSSIVPRLLPFKKGVFAAAIEIYPGLADRLSPVTVNFHFTQ